MKSRFILSAVAAVMVFAITACNLGTPQETVISYELDETTVPSTKSSNPLYGKTAVFLGDSICAGTSVGDTFPEYGYGWGGLIGEANDMTWDNYGKNGAVVTVIEGQDRIVSDQVDVAVTRYPDADYVIFEGGTNDADLLHSDATRLGTISSGDYKNFDTTTFTGAFESLILKIKTAYPDAKVGYIIPPKMGQGPYDSENSHRRAYFDRAIAICEKWDISYIDLWNESSLDPESTQYYDSSLDKDGNIKAGKAYIDGQHLTLAGYEEIVPQIESFMLSL